MVRACQAAAALPMLVGVDEEGGTVNRISGYPAFRDTPFASPQELYQAGGFDAVREDALEKCAFLEELGVNVNFAPVCDVSTDPEDFIYKRSFGRNAAETAQYVRTVVETMGERGMGSVLKHFPGCEIWFDLCGTLSVKNQNKHDTVKKVSARFNWGLDNGRDIEKWDSRIQLIRQSSQGLFFRNRYPFFMRVMTISHRLMFRFCSIVGYRLS